MQARSMFLVEDDGGNLDFNIATDAEAQVCYRYVYDEVIVPVAPVAPVVNPAECTVEDQEQNCLGDGHTARKRQWHHLQ